MNMAQQTWPSYNRVSTKTTKEKWRDDLDRLYGKGVWKDSPGDSYSDGEGGMLILASSTGALKTCDLIIRIHPPGKEEIRQAPLR